jgi:hypothetical protein
MDVNRGAVTINTLYRVEHREVNNIYTLGISRVIGTIFLFAVAKTSYIKRRSPTNIGYKFLPKMTLFVGKTVEIFTRLK